MVTLDLKSVFIGLMIGLCTITLIASENKENIVENSVGRYRIFESNNNPENLYLINILKTKQNFFQNQIFRILPDIGKMDIQTITNENIYETVQQRKLVVKVNINWNNIKNYSVIIDKSIEEWALYNNSGVDVSADGIDNDSDGLIDSNDSDEYGSAREAALRITSQKIINRIINELISNW